MSEKGFFISIGAGKNQCPLIQTAIANGMKIIAVDKNDQAPGFEFASIKIIESVTEFRKIHNTLSSFPLTYSILGIGARSFGPAVYTTAFIAERLGLKYFTGASVKTFQNKLNLKENLYNEGIRVPQSYRWRTKLELKETLSAISYPCIIKPSGQHAKIGIEMLKDQGELNQKLSSIKDDASWLLEEYIIGDEITVSGFVDNGKFILVAISDKITSSEPPFIELSHRLPSSYNFLSGEIIVICQNIILATGLTYGPIIAEFKIDKQNDIFLIEFMPEIGGEYLAEHLIPVHFSYNYLENLINLLTGKEFQRNLMVSKVSDQRNLMVSKSKNQGIKLTQLVFFELPANETVFTSAQVESNPEYCDIFLDMNLVELNTELDIYMGNHSRVKVIGATSANFHNHEELESYIRSLVKINAQEKESITTGARRLL